METVFYAWSYLQRYRATSGEKNFKEPFKTPNFLEAVLAIEIKSDPSPNPFWKRKSTPAP